MNRKIVLILSLIALSEGLTLYGIFMILSFHYNVINSAASESMASTIVIRKPNFLIPVSMGIIGWMTTVYEVIRLKSGDFNGTLRKKISQEGFDRSVYRMFTGRGGPRRLAIMNALDTPKLRNEIAKITNTDWKEVDRNVRILESANLVKIQYSHGSMSVYYLTEVGRDLINFINSQMNRSTPRGGVTHS